ncbi:hypothetical protein BFP97_06925 [Roseivirga sp. 4D4]|uniref:GNAT family N-acetyltransferase n=1 Tax=Roseivirga sp. 4D4 TaxID=1889784 RepID=UPI000853BD61|nr:GNAT family N-acetyltransferase [Roseivirga sp. 4D4]OEK01260.1 hypothetical protein BFP97_06925 [Roseivirga sp. 4D4]
MENKIVIRQARVSDSKKLSILYKTVYIQTYGTEGVSDEFANFITVQFDPQRIEKVIIEDSECIIVAEFNNNIVGVAEIEFDKTSPVGDFEAPELNKLYILDWFCGKGVGSKLMAAVEELIVSRGIKHIWLWVLVSNQRAISFYEKHGFQWIGNALFPMETNTYENKVMRKSLV